MFNLKDKNSMLVTYQLKCVSIAMYTNALVAQYTSFHDLTDYIQRNMWELCDYKMFCI